MIPPTRADDAVLSDLASRMRNPEQRLADLRAQRAANLTGIRRLRQLAERRGIELLRAATAEILDYAERRTRAALDRMPDGESSAEDVLEGLDGDIPLRLRATVRGDSLELDFDGQRRADRGQPQLPALGDQGGLLLRRARRLRPGRAALGRRLAPGHGERPGGVAAQRAAARRRRRRQRRDLEPGRRPRLRGPGGLRPGRRQRPGDDEQPDARRRGLDLLRDDRRRPGRLSRRRRTERRARRDVEHAQHADRGARDRLSGAGHRALGAARQRRRRADTAAATGSRASSRRSSRCATR